MGTDHWHHHWCHVGDMVVARMKINQIICYTCKRGVEVRGIARRDLAKWLQSTGWGFTDVHQGRCPMCRGKAKRKANNHYWVRMAINEPFGNPFMYQCINGGHRQNWFG